MSGTTAFYWQGTRWTAYATFDGVRCFDGTMLRIGTKALSVGGISQNPEPGGIPISVRGALPPSGGTRYYQASYRNVMAYCNPSTLNWSNGVKILWIP
jgi:hypothetical protein